MKTNFLLNSLMSGTPNRGCTPDNGPTMDRQRTDNGPMTLRHFAVVLCLLLTVGIGNAWGAVYEYDFTDNTKWYTTSAKTVNVGTGSNPASATFYYTDGTAWTGGGTNYYFNADGYFMLGKSGATLTMPTFSGENITSVKLYNSSTCSQSVQVNIYSGTNAASTVSTWATQSSNYSYSISSTYKSTTLKVQICSKHNAQITKVEITTESACANTLTTPVVTATPTSGQVVLTWSAVANASSYKLKWNDGDWENAVSGVTKTGLTDGTTYSYQVKAIGDGSSYCDSDPSASANVIPGTYYTVTWMSNGSQHTTTSVRSGTKPTFPDTPTSCDGTSTTFYGWAASGSTWSGKTDDISAKTIYTSASDMPNVSGAVTYHAVFAKATGSGTTTQAATIVYSPYSFSGSGWTTSATGGYSGNYLKFDSDGKSVTFTSPKGAISRFQFTYKLQSSTSCTGHSGTAWWIGDVKFYVSTDGGSNWTELTTKSINDINTGTGLGSDVAKDYDDLSSGGYNAIKVQLGKECGNLGIKGLSATYSNVTYSEYLTSCSAAYTLTFKEWDGGGTASGSPSTGTVSANATSFSFGATPPSKSGYQIEGFYTNTSASSGVKVANSDRTFIASIGGWTNSSSEYTKAANANLYIKWEVKHYTITYNAGEYGTGSIAAGDKTHGTNFTLSSSTFSRDGYTQDGWSTSDGGDKVYNPGGTYSTDADITLYPHWAINNYSVTWKVNGGAYTTGSPSANADYNTKVATLPTAPDGDEVCGGKAFVGWTATENYTHATTAPADLFTTTAGSPAITANTTFHAVFATQSGGGGAAVNTVMWSEDFSGYSADDVPSGSVSSAHTGTTVYNSGSVTYTCYAGTKHATDIQNESLAGGTAKEMLVGGKDKAGDAANGKFIITGIPKGGASELTLSFKRNNNTLTVTVSGTGYSITKVSGSGADTYVYTITCGSDATFGIMFNATTTSNVRLDDISVKVKTVDVSYSDYATNCNKVATPKFSPAAGAYDAAQSVSITCSTPGATIYYTTDGSTPTTSSNVYVSALSVSSNTTIKAYATKTSMDDSNVASATYTFKCATPTFSVPGGSYNDVQSIYLNCTTVGATLYYTTDGSTPTTSSTRYTGNAIVLDAAGTTTIKVIAVKDGLTNSDVASATYVLTKTYNYVMHFSTGTGNPTVPDKWAYKDDDKYWVNMPNGPIPACADDGWVFAGWATSAQAETESIPYMWMPGEGARVTTAEVTMYAVYRKLTSGTSSVNMSYTLTDMECIDGEDENHYWWMHEDGAEIMLNNGTIRNSSFNVYEIWNVETYPLWAMVNAKAPIKDAVFTITNASYKIDHVGSDQGTAILTTDGTTQTVTCSDDASIIYVYPEDNEHELRISSVVVNYYNAKYKSVPTCDPIRVETPERLTSANGEKVYTKELTIVCSGAVGSTLNKAITGTDASMFGCELASSTIVAGELTTTYRVYYQPTAAGANHTATLTFTDGKSPTPNSKAVTLYGRSVPTQFAIVATDGSSNSYVLDGSMTTATRPTALPVTINGSNQVENCPTRAIYTLEDLSTPDRYVHLIGTAGQLWGSAANTNGTTLSTRANEEGQTGWLLESEDLTNYHIINQAIARGVMMYNGVFGHYATSNYGSSGYYGNLKILPIATTCTCLDAPVPNVVAKSDKAILTWSPIEGAASYTVTCSGGSVSSVTGTETLTCEITGLSGSTGYTFTIKPNAASGDCSLTYNGSFTTTTCDDIPVLGEVTVGPDHAIITWTCDAASATVKVYSDAACTAQVGSDYTSKTSPFEVTNLTSNTTYYYKVFAGGEAGCISSLGYFTTEELELDVTEWQADAVIVSYNGDADVTVYTSNEVTHGDKNGHVATDLFFSKYFEAQSNVKMIGLYNGTKDTIDLSNYEIKIAQHGTDGYGTSLTWSKTADINRDRTAAQKKLPPSTEIIFYSRQLKNSNDSAIIKCAEDNPAESGWEHYVYLGARMDFNGDDPVGLFKSGTLIDIIGAGTTSAGYCVKEADDFAAAKTDNTNGFMDAPGGWYTETGIDYNNQALGQTYALSTNRCLLIRLNTVQNGDTAVKYNTTSFATLGGARNEWMGEQIPTPLDGEGNANKKDVSSSCDAFEAIGTYNYSDYYTAFENETKQTTFEDMKSNPFDGTYVIPIPKLDTMACTQIRIELRTGEAPSETLVLRKDIQVPIMVQSGTKATTDAIFHNYGLDEEICRTCDVVVFDGATLEKAVTGAANDVPEVRNLKLYENATLSIPSGRTYTVNSLALRRKGEEISKADIQGTLNIGKTNGVSLDLYIDPSAWHFVCLPYDCNIADITFADGTPAVHRTDYFIKWYNGAYRAANKTGGWETYTGDKLEKGKGYRIGLAGSGIVKQELRFPMANGVIADEKNDKDVQYVYAYGGDKADTQLTPNHKGWNLIGNPYMMYYATDIETPLAVGHLDESGATYTRSGSLRYLVEPINNGKEGYRQISISTHMAPFTAYFVQVGGENNATGGDNPATEETITFNQTSAGKSSIVARRAPKHNGEQMYPVWYGIKMIAPNTEAAQTALLISDEYTDNYDIMNDLVMQYGSQYTKYQHPLLSSTNNTGEMAFNALPDASAETVGVPLNYYAYSAGTYTITTDGHYDLTEVKSAQLFDATTMQYYDLLTDDYTFTTEKGKNTNRFRLFVGVERKKEPQIATDVENVLDGQLSLIAVDKTLVLSGLTNAADIFVYDMSGKLIKGDHATGSGGVWRAHVPTQGVYFVRVNGAEGQQTLRTIVY